MPYTFTPPAPGQTLHLSYGAAQRGRYNWRPLSLVRLEYFVQRGATASTNEFWDPQLVFGTSALDNVVLAIQSASRNGFAAVELTLSADVFSTISAALPRLAVEHQAAISITFPPSTESDYTLSAKFDETNPNEQSV